MCSRPSRSSTAAVLAAVVAMASAPGCFTGLGYAVGRNDSRVEPQRLTPEDAFERKMVLPGDEVRLSLHSGASVRGSVLRRDDSVVLNTYRGEATIAIDEIASVERLEREPGVPDPTAGVLIALGVVADVTVITLGVLFRTAVGPSEP